VDWLSIGHESLRAARRLQATEGRSAISRAYYAAHSVLTQALTDAGYVPAAANRQTPPHEAQPNLIGLHLASRGERFVRELRATIRRLRQARLDADYNRRATIDAVVVRQAIRDAHRVFAELVQAALDRRQPNGYRLRADAESILGEDGWYHVLVTTQGDVRTYAFYDALAEAEGELQDERGLNILLVPVHAD